MSTKIAFFHGKSDKWYFNIMNFAIRVWTFGRYNHCELIQCPTENPDDWMWYSSSSFVDNGTRKKYIKPNLNKWDIYELDDKFNYTLAFEWMERRLGMKYDWVGIWLSQFMHTGINSPKRWFCSEFNSAALQQTALMHNDRKSPQSYSPNRLYEKLSNMGALHKWIG